MRDLQLIIVRKMGPVTSFAGSGHLLILNLKEQLDRLISQWRLASNRYFFLQLLNILLLIPELSGIL